MAPVAKRLRMVSTGSTSSIGIPGPSAFSSMRPRRVARCLLWSSQSRENSLNAR